MNVAVTGATGLIGRAIVDALVRRGDRVFALSRVVGGANVSPEVEWRRFDPNSPVEQPQAFAGADAVIHLAGESIAGRWDASKKSAIRESRVGGTRRLVASLAVSPKRPKALVCASAVGYYGSRGDEPLFESSQPGNDFLACVCVEWERAAESARALGVRTVQLRTGVVLARGGALAAMLPPFRLGVGGPFGSGRGFFPWIALDDIVAMYLFALDRDIHGPVNAVTPDYATSARFAQAVGTAACRPALLPAPVVALRAVLGEFAHTLLASQLVVPARAQDAGFVWRHPLLEDALLTTLRSAAASGVVTFETTQDVTAPIERVFAFFSDPRGLERITPASLRFSLTSVPDDLGLGARISYALRLHNVPVRWNAMIAGWEPPYRFVDVQLHGPYAFWQHEHQFQPMRSGTRLFDRVAYRLPFSPLGDLVRPWVRRDIERIFSFRRQAIEAILKPR